MTSKILKRNYAKRLKRRGIAKKHLKLFRKGIKKRGKKANK